MKLYSVGFTVEGHHFILFLKILLDMMIGFCSFFRQFIHINIKIIQNLQH